MLLNQAGIFGKGVPAGGEGDVPLVPACNIVAGCLEPGPSSHSNSGLKASPSLGGNLHPETALLSQFVTHRQHLSGDRIL